MTSGYLYDILEQMNRISDENCRLTMYLCKWNELYNQDCLLVALQREGLVDFSKMLPKAVPNASSLTIWTTNAFIPFGPAYFHHNEFSHVEFPQC